MIIFKIDKDYIPRMNSSWLWKRTRKKEIKNLILQNGRSLCNTFLTRFSTFFDKAKPWIIPSHISFLPEHECKCIAKKLISKTRLRDIEDGTIFHPWLKMLREIFLQCKSLKSINQDFLCFKSKSIYGTKSLIPIFSRNAIGKMVDGLG